MPEPATDAAPRPVAGQARNTDKVLMVVATMARLAVGLLTFIILARYLGPSQFGVIALAIAYTTFAAVLTDFGFAVSTLRLASADPARSSAIIGDAIAAKALLTIPVTVIGAIIAFMTLPVEWLPVFALVHIGSFANSFGELLLIAARARRRFVLEAKLVISSSVLMLLLFGSITALTRDLHWAAAAFAVTRVLYLIVIRVVLRHWLEPVRAVGRSLAQLREAMGLARGFAFDQILTVLATQADLLFFSTMLSVHEFGVYQAGARLAQVSVSFAPILSNVYLPGLSAAAINKDDDGFRDGSKRLSIEFAVLSLLGGAAFLFLGPIASPLIYGSGYDGLSLLWPGLAAFVILRFGAGSFGIQLAALGHVRTRIASSIASTAALAVLTFTLLAQYQLHVASLLLAAGAVPSISILGIMLARDPRASVAVRWTLPILLVAAVGIIVVR